MTSNYAPPVNGFVQAGAGGAGQVFGLLSLSYTNSLGISPGVVTVICTDGCTIGNDGITDFQFNDGLRSFRLARCRMREQSADEGGENVTRITYEDRRWELRLLEPITARFNQRQKDGKLGNKRLDPGWAYSGEPVGTWKEAEEIPPCQQQTSARAIARLLGIATSGHERLPDDEYPEIRWDLINPAEALVELLDMFGCDLAYQHVDDVFEIVKLGEQTRAADQGEWETIKGTGAAYRWAPLEYLVVTGPTRLQVNMEMEAVGLDTDGSIRKINDLSYAPAGGFETTGDPEYFGFLEEQEGDQAEKVLALARESVWRWYRIKNPIQIPETVKMRRGFVFSVLSNDYRDFLPLAEGLNDPAAANVDLTVDRKEFLVFGNHYDAETDADMDGDVKTKATLDRAAGIVKFSEPVYSLQDSKLAAPSLYLTAVINGPRKITRLAGGGVWGAITVRLEEIEPRYAYELRNKTNGELRNLTPDLDNEAVLRAVAIKNQRDGGGLGWQLPGQEKECFGAWPIYLDGVTIQVSYEMSLEDCKTSVSENLEHAAGVPSREERLAIVRLKRLIKEKEGRKT